MFNLHVVFLLSIIICILLAISINYLREFSSPFSGGCQIYLQPIISDVMAIYKSEK